MGNHTESYKLVVTDNVSGREGVARSFTGWESDPEEAIKAWHRAADDAADGTTVDLVRIEATSVMHQITAARPETTRRYADTGLREGADPPPVILETAAERDADGPADDYDPTAVSRYAAHGYAANVELSPGMARILVRAHQSDGRLSGGLTGTLTALIDRGLMGTVRKGGDPHHLTDRGRRLASFLVGSRDLDQWIGHGSGLRRFDVPQD